MTEQSFSTLCPKCGRRVPTNVATCRCGQSMEALHQPPPQADDAAEAASPSSSAAIAALSSAVTLVVVFVLLLWMRRPPAAAPATLASAPAPAAADVSEKPDPNARSASLDSLPPAALSLEELVSKVMPAVVRIETAAGSGSGFFVKPDTILTNVHVVSTNLRVTVRLADGETLDGRVERTASEYDIAVVRVDSFRSNQVTIPLGSGAHARPGQEVVAVGSPLGLQNTVTRGIVSAIRKSGGVTLVQTDAALNPGNSGGPLLDRSGEAIGISTLSYRAAQGLSFAVAIDHAIDVVSGRIPSTPVTTPAFESMASTP
ncbi:MAG TPA: trypsin-like peptidase domain-containing protein, partial [Vicinamibacterales bacterium]